MHDFWNQSLKIFPQKANLLSKYTREDIYSSTFKIFQFFSAQNAKKAKRKKKLRKENFPTAIKFIFSFYFIFTVIGITFRRGAKRSNNNNKSINNDKNVRGENLSKERKLMVGDMVAWNECRWLVSTKTFSSSLSLSLVLLPSTLPTMPCE